MTAALALLLLSCSGGYLDRTPACRYDVFGWDQDLATWVDSGTDGVFDYTPPVDYIDGISGRYITDNPDTDFFWDTSYARGYYLRKAHASGIGTVYRNGDLDVLVTTVTEDVLGVESTAMTREERHGCKGTVQSVDPDRPEAVADGTYQVVSDDEIDSQTTVDYGGGAVLTQTGKYTSDQRTVTTSSYEDSTVVAWSRTALRADGTGRSDWTQTSDGYDYEGSTELHFDGGSFEDYTIAEVGQDPYAELQIDWNYDGSGTGTWTDLSTGDTCTLVFDSQGQCTYDCDGQTGAC